MPTNITALTCTWCDAEEQQAKCRTCRDGICRHPKLRDRSWNFSVTPNTGFTGSITNSARNFEVINACCDRIQAVPTGFVEPGSFCGYSTCVERSETYRWRRTSQTYNISSYQTVFCNNPSSGQCKYYGPQEVCDATYQLAFACVQGWRMITELSVVSLYISRTEPRYNCEPDRCQYRLALVLEGNMGLSWATQYTQGSLTTVNSSSSFCGTPANCSNGTDGIWPVLSPPAFHPELVPVTMHPWRFVYRRSVDTLEFPMVFNNSNAVSAICGPKCAASIGAISLNLSDPPAFVCNGFEDASGDYGLTDVGATLCTASSCADVFAMCAAPAGGILNYFSGFIQTLLSSSDSGVVNTGLLPTPNIPTAWTVDLW